MGRLFVQDACAADAPEWESDLCHLWRRARRESTGGAETIMPSHPDRVRRQYVCPYCGTDSLVGEHGLFKVREQHGLFNGRDNGDQVATFEICRTTLMCQNPRRLGVITGITG